VILVHVHFSVEVLFQSDHSKFYPFEVGSRFVLGQALSLCHELLAALRRQCALIDSHNLRGCVRNGLILCGLDRLVELIAFFGESYLFKLVV